jgi:hypothetical protein
VLREVPPQRVGAATERALDLDCRAHFPSVGFHGRSQQFEAALARERNCAAGEVVLLEFAREHGVAAELRHHGSARTRASQVLLEVGPGDRCSAPALNLFPRAPLLVLRTGAERPCPRATKGLVFLVRGRRVPWEETLGRVLRERKKERWVR